MRVVAIVDDDRGSVTACGAEEQIHRFAMTALLNIKIAPPRLRRWLIVRERRSRGPIPSIQ